MSFVVFFLLLGTACVSSALASFVLGLCFPWLVAIVGCLVLELSLRVILSRGFKSFLWLQPKPHTRPLYATFLKGTGFFLRFGFVYLFGPLLLIGLIIGYGMVAIIAGAFMGVGFVLASGCIGLLFTCVWWGAFWYVITPFVYMCIGAVDVLVLLFNCAKLRDFAYFKPNMLSSQEQEEEETPVSTRPKEESWGKSVNADGNGRTNKQPSTCGDKETISIPAVLQDLAPEGAGVGCGIVEDTDKEYERSWDAYSNQSFREDFIADSPTDQAISEEEMSGWKADGDEETKEAENFADKDRPRKMLDHEKATDDGDKPKVTKRRKRKKRKATTIPKNGEINGTHEE